MEDLVQQEIEKKIGYSFNEKNFLKLAFTHRSYFNEHKGSLIAHNERMEFLGDAVLNLLISDHLYHHLPEEAEGQLSQLRSRLVDAGACARFVKKVGVDKYILLGKGERSNEGRGRDTILADLFEAILGAIYLDGGIVEASRFFWTFCEQEIGLILKERACNWKALLQDYAQKKYQKPPEYRIVHEVGPAHGKRFQVVVSLVGVDCGKGEGLSKKHAEQAAAEDALKGIENGKK